MTPGPWVFLILASTLVSSISTQKANKPMTGSAAKGAASPGLHVVPDLDRRVAKFARVEMPFHTAGLTPREVKLAEKLVDASRYLEEIYWRQMDPDGLTLYQSLAGSKDPQDVQLRRYLRINASRFDLLDENKPFVGTVPMSPGRAFYPPDLTRDKLEQYVKAHPEKKDAIYSSTTMVRWHDGELEALPYHIVFRSFLEPAALRLREAAALSDDPAFKKFLLLRAEALLTDDYYKSDLAWLDLDRPQLDVILAPYETYDDGLLGVKATYGVAVLVRNAAESRKLELFQKYVADIQDALPLPPEDRPSKHGLQTPMEVMDAPYRAGDLTHGYQAVADNLPNDPRIHELKGSKKIFFKNFMDARVNYVIIPVARHVMLPEQAVKVTSEGYVLGVIMHEIAHGLGPAYARTQTGKVDIREAIGPVFSGLEEAKADVIGLFGLNWMVEHGFMPKSGMEECYASYVGGLFRTVRFGVAEAHSKAEMMEFNYLVEHGALKRQSSGRYAIDYAQMPSSLSDLAKELLTIEATGDRDRGEHWFKKYDVMPVELRATLKAAAGVPVDIDPVFSFKEEVK
jgi:hypothetical protein